MPELSLDVVSADEGHCFATFGSVICSVWRTTLTVNHLQRIEEIADEMRQRWGQYTMIHHAAVIEELPAEPARRFATQSRKRYEDYVKSEALIIDGRGFWASAIRSINTAMLTIAAPKYPSRVFSNIDDAVRWQLPMVSIEDLSEDDYAALVRAAVAHR